jgi:hypothetical protein
MPFRSPLLTFALGGILLGIGVIMLLSLEPWNPSHLTGWEGDEPIRAQLYAIVMIVVGLVFAIPTAVQWVSQGAFKEALLEPPSEGALLGGETEVRVYLVPRGVLRVASAELRLVTEETSTWLHKPDGIDQERGYRTKQMEVHRWSVRLAIPQELGAPWEVAVPVPIPRDHPATFAWERHAIRSRLELDVVLVGKLDLHVEKSLTVLPRCA